MPLDVVTMHMIISNVSVSVSVLADTLILLERISVTSSVFLARLGLTLKLFENGFNRKFRISAVLLPCYCCIYLVQQYHCTSE